MLFSLQYSVAIESSRILPLVGFVSNPVSYKRIVLPLDPKSSCSWMTLRPLQSGPLVCSCYRNLSLGPSYVSQRIPIPWHVLTLC